MASHFGAKFATVETSKMKNVNRRESPRIEIRLRCHITSPVLWLRNATFTANIIRSGLLMSWRDDARSLLPRVGQIMTVDIELPAHHGFGPKCIHVQGTVVRVTNADSDSCRIALSLNYMDFRA